MILGGVHQVGPADAAEILERGGVLLDVREAHELQAARVPGALWIPMSALEARWEEVPGDLPVVVMCHSGGRSHAAARFLGDQGIADASNLAGGIVAWYRAGLPVDQGEGT